MKEVVGRAAQVPLAGRVFETAGLGHDIEILDVYG